MGGGGFKTPDGAFSGGGKNDEWRKILAHFPILRRNLIYDWRISGGERYIAGAFRHNVVDIRRIQARGGCIYGAFIT